MRLRVSTWNKSRLNFFISGGIKHLGGWEGFLEVRWQPGQYGVGGAGQTHVSKHHRTEKQRRQRDKDRVGPRTRAECWINRERREDQKPYQTGGFLQSLSQNSLDTFSCECLLTSFCFGATSPKTQNCASRYTSRSHNAAVFKIKCQEALKCGHYFENHKLHDGAKSRVGHIQGERTDRQSRHCSPFSRSKMFRTSHT